MKNEKKVVEVSVAMDIVTDCEIDDPKNFGIYSQLDRKSKTWFLLSSMCMFLESNGTKS